MEHQKFDIIGDIHGYADELTRLLALLGYRASGRGFAHPERKVIFVGDFIDRGPKIRETLQIARAMMESDQAFAVMGNHEYNALCFHTPDRKGGFLREHSEKNRLQHEATLRAFEGREAEFEDYRRWFMTLPMWLEIEGLRVAHACWDAIQMAALGHDPLLTDEVLFRSAQPTTPEHRAVEVLLKGKEVRLPAGATFTDKSGHERDEIRVKWWLPAAGATFYDMCFPTAENIPELPIPADVYAELGDGYGPKHPPAFVGHYWLNDATPTILAQNLACVDYSVAKEGGQLAAYRWDGERILSNEKFVCVRRSH
jgi:hypothetical protein